MEIGKTYLVNSSRKGTFTARLQRLDETWATLLITAGKASALLEYNERKKGEEVTVRRSFCTFTEQPTSSECGNCFDGKSDMQHACRKCGGTGKLNTIGGNAAATRGAARENDALDEYRAERGCNYGVGCHGSLCYAAAHGRPEECGRNDA